VNHIFISYKSADPDAGADFIGNLRGEIRAAGFQPWEFKGQLIPGDEWRPEIDKAIDDAAALILVTTPASNRSPYVLYEWARACGAGVPVIPLLLAHTELHPRLEVIQHEDFTAGKRPWAALHNAIRKRAGGPAQAAAAKELAALQERLRRALDSPEGLTIGPSARDFAPIAAGKVAAALAEEPTISRRDKLQAGAEVFDQLDAFQRVYADFNTAAD
jgi:hypothetical protein